MTAVVSGNRFSGTIIPLNANTCSGTFNGTVDGDMLEGTSLTIDCQISQFITVTMVRVSDEVNVLTDW